MKIFVKQLQTSLNLNSEIFELVTSHIKATNSLIIPIRDHRAKLQLNAEYMANTASEFWDFYRIFNAYSIIIGSLALVSEKIFRIKAATEEHKSLSTEALIDLPEFKAYLRTQEFSEIMNQVHTMGDTRDLADAYNELRTLSKKLSNEMLTDTISRNVALALNLSDKACKAMTAPLRISNQWNERYLSLHIQDSDEKAIIHFHGSEEEYELLDALIKWFNLLRTRLESECSYQTILMMLADLEQVSRDKYVAAVQSKIATISAGNAVDILATRKKVISYLHQLLNNRKGFPVKRYQDFTSDDLNANWNSDRKVYVLSLYQ